LAWHLLVLGGNPHTHWPTRQCVGTEAEYFGDTSTNTPTNTCNRSSSGSVDLTDTTLYILDA
jgi:hypothetical protein